MTRFKRTKKITNIVTILLISTIVSLVSVSPAYTWPVESYRNFRYKHVQIQDTLSSCGPASLATLMTNFYGKKKTEEDIVEMVKPYLDESIEKLEDGELPEGGVSMLDLRKVSKKLGVPTKGYEIPEKNLLSIMGDLKTPLLIYLEQPTEHFALTVGGYKGKVIMADPSLGIRIIAQNDLYDKWDGLILAFSPNRDYKSQAYKVIKDIKHKVKERNRTKSLAREFL